jgi:hypothetical protein
MGRRTQGDTIMTALTRSPFSLYLNECLPQAAHTHPAAPSAEVHTLVACPTLPFGTRYKLVSIINGRRSTVAIGRATSRYASLNLANLRRRGARLGIQEVHLLK